MGTNTDIHKANTEMQIDLVEIDGKLQRVVDSIETVKRCQEIMASDVGKIKEAVYNPDQGIYARLRELENWKKVHTKLMWMMVSSLFGILGATIIGYINSI